MSTKMTAKEKKIAKIEAVADLQAILPPGSEVYTLVTRVSASGMSRDIKVFMVFKGKITNITFHIARVLGYRQDEHTDALKVKGCGMDMGYHVVYSLSYALHGKDIAKPGYSLQHRAL